MFRSSQKLFEWSPKATNFSSLLIDDMICFALEPGGLKTGYSSYSYSVLLSLFCFQLHQETDYSGVASAPIVGMSMMSEPFSDVSRA